MAFHPENGQLFTTDGGSGEIGQLPDTFGGDKLIGLLVFRGAKGRQRRKSLCGVRGPYHLLSHPFVDYLHRSSGGRPTNQMLVTLFKHIPGRVAICSGSFSLEMRRPGFRRPGSIRQSSNSG
jgi:hypothetical protein